jgi:arginyl-tRNA synthetase
MIPEHIADLVERGLRKAQKKGALPTFEVPSVPVERPQRADHGDYATSLPLKLAKMARMAPMKIAEAAVAHMPQSEIIEKVDVAHPGFINFTLAEPWLQEQVESIFREGERYGNLSLGQGKRVQVEFVSANPTGPLTVGSARNAALGDSLANVLSAAGYEVSREYYVNDAGSQIRLLGETLYARYAQALGRYEPVPEAGYQGAYMTAMGQEAAKEHSDHFLAMDREEAVTALTDMAVERILAGIREDLELAGIHHEVWFSESCLYSNGSFDQVMSLLRQGNHLVERDGAVWFTTGNGDEERDAVVIRSSGEPGYFASDIAYHYNKFVVRGFDEVIDIWGADHQGHVPRVMDVMRALGLDPDLLTVILYQLVTLKRGGELVRVSKRTGDFVTMREVLEEVGKDALRFFLLSRSADAQIDFDLEMARKESDENPVYYIQYAHARIASILGYAGETDFSRGEVSLLCHPAELTLIRRMVQLPEFVAVAARDRAPHHLTYHALDLAGDFHSFYKQCRVVSSEPADQELNLARLKLVAATKIVLARTLHLMGMTAPERM